MQAIGALPGTTLARRSALYRIGQLDSSGPDYINAVVEISTTLEIPHPRLMQRAFVLVPLAEIAQLRVSAAQLQAVCNQAISHIDTA